MSPRSRKRCADCGAVASIRASGVPPLSLWLCVRCVTARVHTPENMALNEAQVELEEFEADGGKLQ